MPRDRRLSVTVQYACANDGLPLRAELRRWARAAFIDRPLQGGEITIRFVAGDEAQDLNQTYRGKPYATNILSFPYSLEPVLAGDLVICADVARQEAQERRQLAAAHFAHLVVHGMLHLQGYDHEDRIESAEKMEAIEREIMAKLGFADPYADA